MTESGRFVSINRDRFAGRVHEFGAVYQALLAKELRAIGMDVALCERTLMARLTAIPEAVCDEFSKRTRDAEGAAKGEAARRGLDWDAMPPQDRIDFMKGGARASREGKADDLSDFAAWREQADQLGWAHKSAVAYGPPAPERSRDAHMAHADQVGTRLLAGELARRAVLGGGDVRLAAARGFIAAGIDGTADIDAMTKAWARDGVQQDGQDTKLIWRQVDSHRVKVTTELHRDQETELVRLARDAAADRSLSLPSADIAAAVGTSGLSFHGAHGQVQRAAMEALGTDGALGVVVGVAGAGKTTLLTPLIAAWQARSYEVWGTAQSWRQANALREAGIGPFNTRALQPFLDGIEDGRTTLSRNSVVVLDELGQVGTRQLLHLLRLRERYGFKVAATGDDRQCQSIEAGPVVDLLRRALGTQPIPEILSTVRQRTEEERHIAGLFRDGDAGEAVRLKVANGSAELVEGGYREAVRRVAVLYRERREANRGDPAYTVTISAPTNADAREIGMAVRDQRRAMGEVGEDRVRVRATDGRGGAYTLALAEGDSVRLFAQTRALFTDGQGRRKSASIGDNGTVLRVVAVLPAEGLSLQGESGKVGFVSWEALRDRAGSGRVALTYGDCGTIDSAQGITSDEHINALPAGSQAVQGFKAYVAESRHRVRSYLVGSMGAEMREAMTRRPMGLPEPERGEAVQREAWANVVRNLSRQAKKESALAFLEDATGGTVEAAKALQAGLRLHEARAASGHPRTTLRRTFGERAAQRAMPQVLEQLGEAAAARAPVMARIAAMVPEDVARPAPKRQTAAPPAKAPVQTPTARTKQRRRVRVGELEAQQQFADAMRVHGLKPQGLPVLDGKLRYVPVEGNKGRARSGAYRGYYDEGRPAGAIYNWKQGGFVGNWQAEGKMEPLPAAEQAALAAQAETRAAERERLRVAREDAGARTAVALVVGSRPADAAHPYLVAKGIEAHGLRMTAPGQTVTIRGGDGKERAIGIAGRLLVPLQDIDGRVRNVQTIGKGGIKLYLGGAQKIGTFHLLGSLEPGRPVVVSEGFATGATVHQATGLTVAVALDTSNLAAVAAALRDRDPARPIYLAADNDHHLPLRATPLPNAGREKAEAAARAVGGRVLLPDPVAGRVAAGQGTDWNDYEASYGQTATREALRTAGLAEVKAKALRPVAVRRAAERQGSGMTG